MPDSGLPKFHTSDVVVGRELVALKVTTSP
jgi:hypothetical protein